MGRIKLIAGHGGGDPGAVANGHKEADLTIEARQGILAELQRLNFATDLLAGTRIELKTDDDSQRLAAVIAQISAGARKEDLLLDIHWNAASASATGTECLVKNNASQRELAIANLICSTTAGVLKIPNRGIKPESITRHKRLGILHTGAGTSILWEIAFITNPSDLASFHQNKAQLFKLVAKILHAAMTE